MFSAEVKVNVNFVLGRWLSKLFCLPSEKSSTPKGKNWLTLMLTHIHTHHTYADSCAHTSHLCWLKYITSHLCYSSVHIHHTYADSCTHTPHLCWLKYTHITLMLTQVHTHHTYADSCTHTPHLCWLKYTYITLILTQVHTYHTYADLIQKYFSTDLII